MGNQREKNSDMGELLKGNTPTLLLAVLEAGPLHGYAIAREIEQRSADTLSLGEGSLYLILRALEREGHVTSRWEAQLSGPARRIYEITSSGKGELRRREETWRRFAEAIDTVLFGRKPNAEPI